jgi:hypothetical protein
MIRSFYHAALLLSLFVSSVSAGPAIQFDTKTYNCGTVVEGKTGRVNAAFVVKNTGNSILKLKNVRPGCGCTIVKYDSLVQPGKSVKIESQMNLAGFKTGDISKSITVTSNAENEPTARLTITVKIKAVIDVSEPYISLDASKADLPHVLFLSCNKPDLKVSAVSFKASDGSADAGWQNIPFTLKFNWIPIDSVSIGGNPVFRLELYPLHTVASMPGEFTFKTNHPDKPEMTMMGIINK